MRATRSRTGRLIAAAAVVALALAAAAILDRPPAGAQPQGPAGPLHPWPSIWTVTFTLRDVAAGKILDDSVTRTTTWTGMSHGVRGLPDMLVLPETARGSFRNVQDVRRQGYHGDIVIEGSPDPPLLPMHPDRAHERQLLVGRRVTIDACEGLGVEGLDVWLKGSKREQGREGSFVVSNNFRWPKGTETRTVYQPTPVRRTTTPLDETTSLLTLTEQEVPYDYRLLVNAGTAHPLPSEGIDVTGLRQVSRTIDYTIARPPMRLELKENVPSLVGRIPHGTCGAQPGLGHAACRPVEGHPHFAIGRRNRYIHANIDIRLLIGPPGGEQDVTNEVATENGRRHWFHPVRIRRGWTSGLRADGTGDQTYTRFTPAGDSRENELVGDHKWYLDNTGVGSGPNWLDLPGIPGDFRPSAAWPPERFTQEFLLAVRDFPEFGFLYYVVHIDTKPGQYRVRTRHKPVSADEFCEALTKETLGPNGPAPYDHGEIAAGEPWRRVPR